MLEEPRKSVSEAVYSLENLGRLFVASLYYRNSETSTHARKQTLPSASRYIPKPRHIFRIDILASAFGGNPPMDEGMMPGDPAHQPPHPRRLGDFQGDAPFGIEDYCWQIALFNPVIPSHPNPKPMKCIETCRNLLEHRGL